MRGDLPLAATACTFDAKGEQQIDEERIKPLIEATLNNPDELASIMALMTRWREPRGRLHFPRAAAWTPRANSRAGCARAPRTCRSQDVTTRLPSNRPQTRTMQQPQPATHIDVLKIVGSQLIVLHHPVGLRSAGQRHERFSPRGR